ncbi:hypothetical protein CDL15_Pgr022617 [Punica granatum]|uniref:Uncharacterized protein n=1 Tax=Punica granatum TaxID=22663 RepID=A0A218XS76_PUNGR|nr:hypothetical protein CDL15_Pgr022617 [Punica granatum]PKI74716.1 hypothetical protein CRG98_005043 [Punica granatum]
MEMQTVKAQKHRAFTGDNGGIGWALDRMKKQASRRKRSEVVGGRGARMGLAAVDETLWAKKEWAVWVQGCIGGSEGRLLCLNDRKRRLERTRFLN